MVIWAYFFTYFLDNIRYAYGRNFKIHAKKKIKFKIVKFDIRHNKINYYHDKTQNDYII